MKKIVKVNAKNENFFIFFLFDFCIKLMISQRSSMYRFIKGSIKRYGQHNTVIYLTKGQINRCYGVYIYMYNRGLGRP
jgi:hypothetical protein